jgi:hypothetical protein
MLHADVARAIAAEAWFHIWPIVHVDDGIPLLTSMTAADFHARVESTLDRYYRLAQSEVATRG